MNVNDSRMLVLKDIRIRLQDRLLFAPLNLTVHPGEVVTVMGPSGCGKSTLLNYICGILPPAFEARGSVRLGGRELTGLPLEQRRIGILFQDILLFPHLSVAENLAFGLRAGHSRQTRRFRVETALQDAGLEGLGGRDPATLSAGQQARAALMRTLLAEPEALLLDEPFSKLDTELRARIRTFVFEHARQRRLPTLLVTHDPADATDAAGPAIVLDRAPALSDGNPTAAAADPENPKTAPPPVPTAPRRP
ncbi:MAG TPA: ATP-binding cassette domain-containing protein [Candidatus Competibacter sp.]|nr:ATP-binding cassette domain-containing protein [Candidatus Competibacter sp.]HUM93182.1 ATP-binding cassette domain-containing protein [Candidatus Competibacter sp.]